jgi:hypothetical protein
VYTGKNPENGHPIIKAHLNPLVWWIWAGAHLMLIGTLLALVPNMPPPPSKPVQPPAQPAARIEEATESRTTVEAGTD